MTPDPTAEPIETTEPPEGTTLSIDTEAMLAEINTMLGEFAPGAEGGEGEPEPSDETAPAEPGEAEPSEGEDGEGEGTGAGESPALLAPPGTIEFEGRMVPVDDVRALLALGERLRSDPVAATEVSRALGITPSAAAEPAAPVKPEWLDEDDPAQVAMWTRLEQLETQQSEARQADQATAQRQREAYVVDSFKSAVTSFRTAHPTLDDATVRSIADNAARMGLFDTLEPKLKSLPAAFERGMEMTLWADPNLRSVIIEGQAGTVSPDDKSKDRKRKASALAGSSGSAPRTAPPVDKPRTREELMEQMLNDVRNDPQLSG